MTIFKINEAKAVELCERKSDKISEANLEKIIFNSLNSLLLKESEIEAETVKKNEKSNNIAEKIFGESGIFRINAQQRCKTGKISDILAIDGEGRIIVMELKKDAGKLGVDMQALQYLVQIKSLPTGLKFFESGLIKSEDQNEFDVNLTEAVKKIFGDDDLILEKINKEQRIILIAKDFEESLFSMGEWLSQKGVGFTCISYDFYKFGEEEFISFSTKFDAKPYNSYQLSGSKNTPANSVAIPYYYHNSGCSKEDVKYFIENNLIGCGFDGEKFDEGYRILNEKYGNGDHIFLYQNGAGIMAVGKVLQGKSSKEEKDENNKTWRENKGYKLLDKSEKLPHRLKVQWEAAVLDVKHAFSREKIEKSKERNRDIKTILLPIPKTSSAVSRNKQEAQKFYDEVKEYLTKKSFKNEQ